MIDYATTALTREARDYLDELFATLRAGITEEAIVAAARRQVRRFRTDPDPTFFARAPEAVGLELFVGLLLDAGILQTDVPEQPVSDTA